MVGHERSAALSVGGTELDELTFLVSEAPEGGYTAHALGVSIVTEADDVAGLLDQIWDAVCCHFEEGRQPTVIHLR